MLLLDSLKYIINLIFLVRKIEDVRDEEKIPGVGDMRKDFQSSVNKLVSTIN